MKPWRPGDLVEGESAVQDILNAIAFVRQDVVFTQIGERLAVRNCKTVDDLAEYTSVEFCALARQFDIKHKARVYQATIEAAIQRTLDADCSMKSELGGKVKKQSGGDMLSRSLKVEPSEGFNLFTYTPDAHVYSNVIGQTGEYIGDEDEKLYLDKLWLFCQADPEPSVGDYLPSGMKQRLAKIHKQLKLPPFQPTRLGKPGAKERSTSDVFSNRFFNGRFIAYKRIVLDERHRDRFSDKVQAHITFVASDSEALLDNERNAAFEYYLKVHSGAVAKCEPQLPSSKENRAPPPAQPPSATAPHPLSAATVVAAAAPATTVTDSEPGVDVLDGMELDPGSNPAPPPPLPKAKGLALGGVSTLTKSDQLKAKRAAAVGASLTAKKPRKVVHDSSDDDSSDDDAAGAITCGSPCVR